MEVRSHIRERTWKIAAVAPARPPEIALRDARERIWLMVIGTAAESDWRIVEDWSVEEEEGSSISSFSAASASVGVSTAIEVSNVIAIALFWKNALRLEYSSSSNDKVESSIRCCCFTIASGSTNGGGVVDSMTSSIRCDAKFRVRTIADMDMDLDDNNVDDGGGMINEVPVCTVASSITTANTIIKEYEEEELPATVVCLVVSLHIIRLIRCFRSVLLIAFVLRFVKRQGHNN